MVKFYKSLNKTNKKEILINGENLNLIIKDLKNYYKYAKTNLQEIHLKFIDLKKNIFIKEEKNIINDHIDYIKDILIQDSLKNFKNKINKIEGIFQININKIDKNNKDDKNIDDEILNIIQNSISQDISSLNKGIEIFDGIINSAIEELYKEKNLSQEKFAKKELDKEINSKIKNNQIYYF